MQNKHTIGRKTAATSKKTIQTPRLLLTPGVRVDTRQGPFLPAVRSAGSGKRSAAIWGLCLAANPVLTR